MKAKRYDWIATACLLAIPIVFLVEGWVFVLLEPELARGSADYSRNYRLIEKLRHGSMAAAGGLVILLWLATCWFVLKGKGRSPLWMVLSLAGPVGFAFLCSLKAGADIAVSRYARMIGGLGRIARVAYEATRFVVIWALAVALMVAIREVMIHVQSWRTGVPVEKIVEQQMAESGMMAFGEGLMILYLVVLLYVGWPLVFNFALGVRARLQAGSAP